MNQIKKPWTNKRKAIYAMQFTTLLAMILYFAWLIVDCVFISKGIYNPTTGEFGWDEGLYSASKVMSCIFLASVGLVVACNTGYLFHRIFNFKSDREKNLYGIIINSLIIFFGLIGIIFTSDYIKYDIIVYRVYGYEPYLTHNEYVNFVSALFAICCFSMLITWEKTTNFSIKTIEQDFKSIIRIFALVPLLFYPFMVWLLMPVNSLDSTNNIIGQVVTSPMTVSFALIFIGLFGEFVIQMYRRTKLMEKDNLIQTILYGSLFGLILILFIVTQSFSVEIDEIDQSWKSTIGLVTPELVLALAAMFLTIYDKKIKPKQKQESIYA